MTQDEKDKEISAMVQERNKLRGNIACLENKKERIQKGLKALLLALNTEDRLQRITDGGVLIPGNENAFIPSGSEIIQVHNDLLSARIRLEELTLRINSA